MTEDYLRTMSEGFAERNARARAEKVEDDNRIREHELAVILAQQGRSKPSGGSDVFLVHGRHEGAKESAALALERLTGRRPIILHEQQSKGRTIIEQIEAHSAYALAAVVILTPDDFGGPTAGARAMQSSARARQNVVFEFGYFIGLLGRDKVVALTLAGVELPSDLNGIIYVDMSRNGWVEELANNLRGINGLRITS